MDHLETPQSPYVSPPTKADTFCVQGSVMLAVERQFALAERVQRAIRIRQLELGVIPRNVQRLDDFFNAIIVRGLVSYNRILVAESQPFGVTLPAETTATQTLCRVLADELRMLADELKALGSIGNLDPIETGAAAIYLTHAACHLKVAADIDQMGSGESAHPVEIGETGRPVSVQDKRSAE